MTTERIDIIRTKLTNGLTPESLEIIDESAKHAGHEGAKSGGGHFIVNVVATAFSGKSPIQRHRMVYEILGDTMQTEIHALSINARTPDETHS